MGRVWEEREGSGVSGGGGKSRLNIRPALALHTLLSLSHELSVMKLHTKLMRFTLTASVLSSRLHSQLKVILNKEHDKSKQVSVIAGEWKVCVAVSMFCLLSAVALR